MTAHGFTAGDRCYACGRKLHWSVALKGEHNAWTSDGQPQFVGPECSSKIQKAREAGYQPPKGGPRMFASAELAAATESRG